MLVQLDAAEHRVKFLPAQFLAAIVIDNHNDQPFAGLVGKEELVAKDTPVGVDAGFEKRKIRSGFFEIYMNMWFTASK